MLRVWVHAHDEDDEPEPVVVTHQYTPGAEVTACCRWPLTALPAHHRVLRVGPVAARHARPCTT